MGIKLFQLFPLVKQDGHDGPVSLPGFALSIAIVAKCNKKINLAQDFFIWRKCVATTFCQVT